jgi:hypothetical protein
MQESVLSALREAETLVGRINADVATLRREFGFGSPRKLLERAFIIQHSACPGCPECETAMFAKTLARAIPPSLETHHTDMAAVLLQTALTYAAFASEALLARDALSAHRNLNAAQHLVLAAAGHRLGISLAEGALAGQKALADRGKTGADKAHWENRDMKREARALYASTYRHLSKNEAAPLIKNHFPVKESTIRTWLSEPRK